MKFSFSTKLISCILTLVLLFTASGATLVAAAEETSGKYVKDVFIAYGEKKEDAEKWLRDHGWEPFTDLNDGKNSKAKTDAEVSRREAERLNKEIAALKNELSRYKKDE